tara:strand:+ start:579 stop:842 length:264 start_codon:yes stop_codon:yes gene_type:complete
MKLFVYKSLFIFLCIFLLFHLTIGYQIRSLEKEIETLASKENLEMMKSKIRDEMKDAIKKDRYLNKDDAELIGSFIDKIQQEIILQK